MNGDRQGSVETTRMDNSVNTGQGFLTMNYSQLTKVKNKCQDLNKRNSNSELFFGQPLLSS